jgi:hypothetical protein
MDDDSAIGTDNHHVGATVACTAASHLCPVDDLDHVAIDVNDPNLLTGRAGRCI